MSGDDSFDLFTIGAGSGGVRASRVAASLGARVGIAEERYLGGTCVNVGCVPKKLFTYAAHFGEAFEDAKHYGWKTPSPQFDWATLIRNKDREIKRLNGIYRKLLTDTGCQIFESRATLEDAHTIRVGDRTITSKNILIATGGWPSVPTFEGNEHAITSNEIFHLEQLPGHVLIGGGGYIAVEFAGILTGMGVRVTLVHRRSRVLRGFDDDIRASLTEEIPKRGVMLRMGRTIDRIERIGSGLRAQLSDKETLEIDQVLCCYGRSPLTEGLGLEAAGVETNQLGAIEVDDHYRTSAPNIYAVGDVTDRVKLTPVALAEGMAVAHNLFGSGERLVSYENIPTAVFSNPNVGTVGLTEEQAKASFPEIEVYLSRFRPLKHTLTGFDTKAMMKIIIDKKTRRVVGCHIVGDDAAEIIQAMGIALNCGATKEQLDATIGVHPTAAEELVTMRQPR